MVKTILGREEGQLINPYRYYSIHDIDNIARAISYEELTPIALGVIQRMPPNVEMVCGPITTGGIGYLYLNLAVFKRVIDELARSGKPIFTQLPFQNAMQNIKARLLPGSDDNSLMEIFYRPIFESGLIKKLNFIPKWETSSGACWEHGLAEKLNIKIVYL